MSFQHFGEHVNKKRIWWSCLPQQGVLLTYQTVQIDFIFFSHPQPFGVGVDLGNRKHIVYGWLVCVGKRSSKWGIVLR
jgi:uncharacterized OB-fold protein